ncbi:hypothetical protein, partial [Streptomyces acidiscabies]
MATASASQRIGVFGLLEQNERHRLDAPFGSLAAELILKPIAHAQATHRGGRNGKARTEPVRTAFWALCSYEKRIGNGRAAPVLVAYFDNQTPWQLCNLPGDMVDAEITDVGEGERFFAQYFARIHAQICAWFNWPIAWTTDRAPRGPPIRSPPTCTRDSAPRPRCASACTALRGVRVWPRRSRGLGRAARVPDAARRDEGLQGVFTSGTDLPRLTLVKIVSRSVGDRCPSPAVQD